MPRTEVVSAHRDGSQWRITLRNATQEWCQGMMLVNAGGPWAGAVIKDVVGTKSGDQVRLVRGSHIVTRSLFDHKKSYFLRAPMAESSLLSPMNAISL